MKHLTAIFTFTFFLHLSSLSASAAVPLKWTVETSRAQPATFEAYQGEKIEFEATLKSYGKPLEAPGQYAFYWQTNGMGSAYWSSPVSSQPSAARQPEAAPSPTNVLRATWLPSYDVGARAYNCFIGLTGTIYHAAFQLRLRPSPGAVPNELPLPQKVIDFSQVTVLNPPWSGGGSGGIDTNAVIDITTPLIASATNDLNTTLTDAISSATNAVPLIVMGNLEVRADLTAKVQSGWTNQWEPLESGEYHSVLWDNFNVELGFVWCTVDSNNNFIVMGGDYTNPDATELTFPDGTVTRRVPATVETKLATTNDLFATVRSATNDLNTTLNDPNTGKLGVHGDGSDLGQGDFRIRRHGTITLSPYDDYIFRLEDNNLYYDSSGVARFGVTGGFKIQYGDLNLEEGSTLKINGVEAISTNNPAFVSAVLATGFNIDTNDVAVIKSFVNDWPVDPATGATTIGGILAALAAAIALLKKNKLEKGLSDAGVPTDANVVELFSKSNTSLTGVIATETSGKADASDLPIPRETKSAGFTTESYKRFIVAVSGAMTVTLHKPTGTDADVFECRFDGSGLSADAEITFAKVSAFGTDDAITTMDTDCGNVKAGKVALMSAFWNGTTWDVNWKVEG